MADPEQRRRNRYYASFPERALRAGVAVAAGTIFETFQLVLPRFVRRSRFYEATAKNLLRVAIEVVGKVEASPSLERGAPSARQLGVRKGAGNVVELGSIAAFGFSPLWLLAGASDILRGSRTYLNALVDELKREGVIADEAEFSSVDELLGALEGGTGTTARLIDIPPLELQGLRTSLEELRSHAGSLPSQDELAALYRGLRATAERERRPLLEVSAGVGLAFATSARKVSERHIVVPYREDWQPLRREGFGAYARRIARPYGRAASAHWDPQRASWTERLLERISRDV